MATFMVMEPPRGDLVSRAERAVFVRDGFAFLAFLLPAPWLLVHRLWIEAGLALVVSIGAAALGGWVGSGLLATLLSLAISAYVGLEGNGLRVNALRRRGWRDWGPVEAQSRNEAETRYAYAVADGPVSTPADVVEEPQRPATFGRQTDLFAVSGYR